MDIYINSYGTYLSVKDDMFSIKFKLEDGSEKSQQLAAHKVKSIVFTTNAALSTDAIRLALSNNIDIVFLKSTGHPLGRVWHSKMGSTTRIRREQLLASNASTGLYYTKKWLAQKLQNQMDFLKELKKHRSEKYGDYLQDKIERIQKLQQSIQDIEAEKTADIADSLRGYEGTSGRLYFQALSHILPEKYQFKGRSFRPANDPFNAFLNYAYGILYSKVEKALVIAGLDPYIGFMHRDDYNKLSLVFDFIEPYRIYAEKVVFKLFSAKKINIEHTSQFNTETTPGYSLNKMGKRLLAQHFSDYLMDDKIRYKNRNQNRFNALQMDAHSLAQVLLTNSNDSHAPIDLTPPTQND